ncbi:hypothetical protein HMPREF1404_00728 [Helicobacter pylori GAM210Bi]|nr:hypothetical protein HMPREF1404_00728 [Helicobacter pylori GAM210Bi]
MVIAFARFHFLTPLTYLIFCFIVSMVAHSLLFSIFSYPAE